MSKLIVEVCEIDEIIRHPNADKLEIARVKGWNTIVKKNVFSKGQKCVFFPPDSILPSPLIDRLGIRNYLQHLPKNEKGERPESMRVVAARLRGEPSFGTIMPLDPALDSDWAVGTDVADHYGVAKYEPPVVYQAGQAEPDNSRFYRYTDIENFANYSTAIPDGTEVVFTEKLHGMNCRVGLVLDTNESGEAAWVYMAGSHDVRRKQFYRSESRYRVVDLIENQAVKGLPKIDDVFLYNGKTWQVEKVIKPEQTLSFWEKIKAWFKPNYEDIRVQVFQVKKQGDEYETIYNQSEFWIPVTTNVKNLLEHIRTQVPHEPGCFSIMLYGELIGTQDMKYGIEGYGFRAFDLSINNKYLDFDLKKKLFDMFEIEMVPVLYRGPFSVEKLAEYTSGPTTLCDPEKAGAFKGREGIVCTPVVEVAYCPVLNGRRIVKSVSADYHARKDGTEFH